MYKSLLAFGLLNLAGCPGGDDSADSDVAVDTDTGGDSDTDTGTADPTFAQVWDASGVVVTVTGGMETFVLGMAQTKAGGEDNWTGEDCLNGYTTGDGTTFLYCHPMAATGVTLTAGAKPNNVVEGSTTVMSGAIQDDITYSVTGDTTGTCWTWGNDVTYYTAGGCTAM